MSDVSDKQSMTVKRDDSEQPWPDFVVRTWMINEYVVGVEAFEVIGVDNDDGPPMMLKKGWKSSPDDCTSNPDEAELFVEGSIKWDGCSDLTIGRDGYIHSCGREGPQKLGALLERLYDIARDAMPGHAIFD